MSARLAPKALLAGCSSSVRQCSSKSSPISHLYVSSRTVGRSMRSYATAEPTSSSEPSSSSSPRVRSRFPNISSPPPSSSIKPPPSGVRVGTLFLALTILGLGATSVGLYNYYTSLKTFPEAIRTELRSALRCKARQDYTSSHKFFGQAWTKIVENQNGVADQLDILKITGIAVSWSEMLEEAARRADGGSLQNPSDLAYNVLKDGYDYGRDHVAANEATATAKERLRAVAMAVKLSELAEGSLELEDQTEQQLTWAVEQVLRLSTSEHARSAKSATIDEDGILLAELGLPNWLSKTDVGGTLEALGNLYARKGNVEYAMPLYLQTISLLLPPPGAKQGEPSIQEKCHAATIMNNLSSLIASSPKAPSREISKEAQAKAWASKALAISQGAMSSSSANQTGGKTDLLGEADTCKPIVVVALYNLGMLALMENKKEEATRLLNGAKDKAKEWQMKDAEVRAADVLRTL